MPTLPLDLPQVALGPNAGRRVWWKEQRTVKLVRGSFPENAFSALVALEIRLNAHLLVLRHFFAL